MLPLLTAILIFSFDLHPLWWGLWLVVTIGHYAVRSA